MHDYFNQIKTRCWTGGEPRFDGGEVHGRLDDVEVIWKVERLWVDRLQERPRLVPTLRLIFVLRERIDYLRERIDLFERTY